ncbi:hypothetical protein [Aeromonas phage 85AhydR10PP]|nr:hypothetical protein [Aeromonas phage 85AhydR10PP]
MQGMNKTVRYEWDAEIWEMCPVTDELMEIHHDHHEGPTLMLATMAHYPIHEAGKAYHPVVVRDMEGSGGQSLDRQWAYLNKGEDGKWTLPEYFIDGCLCQCAKVPKYLKDELEKAQK